MRVALITIFQVPNYGSVLQAYATQTLLENIGAHCEIIDYKYPNGWHWKHGAARPSRIRSVIRKLFPSNKKCVLDRFRNEYFNLTKSFRNIDELESADWTSFDAFIVGSDQVWNYRFVLGDPVFLLSFVPACKLRFSVASSFAQKTLPERFRELYKRELCKFSAISVRENNGAYIINHELQIENNVKVLLDPTLLLSKEDWLNAIPRSDFRKKRPYILFYMWTYAFEPRPYIFDVVKFFQEKEGYDVIALEGYTKPENAHGVVMENCVNSTIPEFIDLFINADLVITSSFHGTAFAVNFGIPLISVIPDGNEDDRQTTLLTSLGAANSICKKGKKVKDINPEFDRELVSQKLSNMRKDNLSWINKILYCERN